jgi:hypothetical protein
VKLQISKNLSLPVDFVTESTAILARRRMGKSFTGRRIVEQVFRARQQVVVVDPKGDWWGIRSSTSGKEPGLPIVILGGGHGDIPLEVGSGELVARMVVEQQLPVLIDLSDFRKHEVATFMTAFLETLYRLKNQERYRTPMLLVIDEADAIAPQSPYKGEERMLGAAEDLVRRGGQRGIGVVLITQRAAVLNKNVLTQVGILILLRTTGSQDLDQLNEWIKKHARPEEKGLVMETLAALPVGTAWVWAPGWPDENGIFKCVQILPIETYDSGATPKVGRRSVAPKTLADVDLEAFRKEMTATIEKAKAGDPKELRRRIVELEAELKKANTFVSLQRPSVTPKVTPKVTEVPVFRAKDLQPIEKALRQLSTVAGAIENSASTIKTSAEAIGTHANGLRARLEKLGAAGRRVEPAGARPVRPELVSPAPPPAAAPNGLRPLDKCESAILHVVAGEEGCTIGKAALLSGYRQSGGFRNALSSLRSRGYLVGANNERMYITAAGRTAIADKYVPPPRGAELVQHWLTHPSFGSCERNLLRVIINAHQDGMCGMQAEAIAASAGYVMSGGVRNALSSLRTAGVIEGKNNELISLSQELGKAVLEKEMA